MSEVVLLSIFESKVWANIAVLIGEVVLILIFLWIILAIIIGIVIAVSIKRKRIYLPGFFRTMFTFVSAGVKMVCALFGVESRQLIEFLISLDNEMNKGEFERTPIEERVIFFPQCLRNRDCPARLRADEGIKCVNCGRCGLGRAVKTLNDAGYKTFIIPGSTFIKRMVKKHHPKAMIGVGCMMEVKEGLEMGKKIKMITLGVVTTKDGCVETTMDYHQLMDVASLGLDKPLEYPEE